MSYRQTSNSGGNNSQLRALLDMASIIMLLMIVAVVLMALIINENYEKDVVSEQPSALNAQRPVGSALRVQVSWDANFDSQLSVGETCRTKQDVGFTPHVRPQECSSADVDMWVVRVQENGNQLFYAARGQADKLFSSSPDDKGFERNEDKTFLRYEQMVAQFALLPPGSYHIVVDLFQPDIYLPSRNVKVCGVAVFREGVPEHQHELFNGCVEVSIGGSAPQTVTVVSFEVDGDNNLVPGSVSYDGNFSLETEFYTK